MATVTIKGGDKLQKKLADIAKSMGGGSVSVGFMEDAKYPTGEQVAAVAYWNEYGKSNQPARPFFRQMIAKESPTWGDKMARLAKATDYDGPRVLSLMGEDIGGALVQSIQDLNEPALSPVTLMLRKMYGNRPELITGAAVGEAARRVAAGEQGATGTQAKPLIWTAHMQNSVAYSVNDQSSVKINRQE